MKKKINIIIIFLFSFSLQAQVCSDFPEITATSTTICTGLTTTLSINYTPPIICNMNITPTTIPLGNPIPGFTYGGMYNGHYYYVYNTPTSWTQGELICRQNGGYLVCINDINENAFVSNLTNNNIWIGLFRDPTTCQFRWLDCMNINFTNWRSSEPNGDPCGEPYTQIIRGCSFGLNTWNNLNDNSANGSCYSNMVPILEIDPIIYNNPINTTTTYLWSTGETTASISPTPLVTTAYWVDVTTNGATCRKNITINVTPTTTPTFNQIEPICSGAVLNPLPTTSNNGITGTWSSTLNNTATTTYTFTPNTGQCSSTATMTVTIISPIVAPTGSSNPFFCSTATVADINVIGTSIKWYDSATGGNELASTTLLINGTNYYASKIVNGCESNNRLAVSINLMNPIITASATTVCKGSPVNLQVNISPTSPIDPRWELLIPPSNYNGTQINLSETAYDRINNYVYSLFKQGSNLITYRFNLNNNSVSNIVTTNIPNNVSTFTYDYSNNRLIAGRTGRDIISAVPANGGAWSQIGNGSFDAESYGSQYYWNSNNQKTGFFGGYGFFYVRNWIWENGSSWTNSFANNNNCGINIPAKRVTQLALGKPNTNKIYFFSGQGSCTGQQTVSSCNLGSPWATDVGVFCWLKDLWELDLNTQTFNNILPVNSSSITKEGNFVYNYTENSFYIVGGYSPSPIYNSNFGNITNYETSILKYDPSINSGFIPFVVQGTPPPALTLNSIGVNKTYYDAANNQIVWIRKDGVWAVKLGSTSSINSILWSTGETTSSINPSPLETTTYWVDVTANGITCRKSITINVQNSPPPSGSESQSFCEGKSIEDIAINGSSIKWYSLINSNNPINRNSLLSNATNYFASQTINGCESEDRLEVNIQITHPEKPTGETIQRFCNSKTINDLSVIGSDIKWYSTSVSLMTLNNTSVLSDGESYYATQTINGCESENRFKTTVNLISIPNVNGSSPQVFCTEDQSTLKNIVVNGGTPQWYSTFTNGSPISESQKLQDKTTYYASNIDKVSGCESPQRLAVSIELINCDVVIFNSIKVDAEPMSDRLYIDDISYFPNNSIQIFNRYGRLVWETKGYNNDSNAFKGKANVPDLFQKDEQLPAGTYFYILNYFNFIDRTQKEKNGYLQLFNRN